MSEDQELEPTELDKDERNWGMYCHLAVFLGFIFPVFGNFIGPGLVWILKKEEFPFVNDQGKEVLNFQITMLLASLVAGFLAAVFIGQLLLVLIPIYLIVFTIVGAVKASEGKKFRYPYTLRLLK